MNVFEYIVSNARMSAICFAIASVVGLVAAITIGQGFFAYIAIGVAVVGYLAMWMTLGHARTE